MHRQQRPAPAPVTFLDVAAYFSDEEWKLMHEWQKELYQSVMQEIHQALVSLGPLIATTVFSIRPKEKPVPPSMDNPDLRRRYCIRHSPCDSQTEHDEPIKINKKRKQCLRNPREAEQNDCVGTGYQFTNPDTSLTKEGESSAVLVDDLDVQPGQSSHLPSPGMTYCPTDEQEALSMNHQHSARIDCNPSGMTYCPTDEQHSARIDCNPSGFPFLDADFCLRSEDASAVSPMGHSDAGGGECRPDPSSGHPDPPKLILVHIKEEDESYPGDQVDHEELKAINSRSADPGNMNKQRKVGNSIRCTQKSRGSQAISRKAIGKELHSSYKGTKSKIHVWSKSTQQLREEKPPQCESDLSNPVQFSIDQGQPKGGYFDAYNECGTNVRNSQFLNCPQNTQQIQRPYACNQCEKSYSLKGELIRHIRTHTGVRPYACTDCEKSFFQKTHLITHRRTHTGEKPYVCSFCYKRFNRKDNLNGHQRIHTGEKPYKCIECDKSFIRKGDLNEHRRKHI